MDPTTTGHFRVLADPRGDGWLLVDVEADGSAPDAFDPLAADLADGVDAPESGNVVAATLAWESDRPTVTDLSVERADVVGFADGVTDMFEAASETFQSARAAGDGMASRVLQGTDGDALGVVYTFADAPGQDTFARFRDGSLPLEPLLDRVDEGRDDDAPRATYVLRPAADEFVAVAIAFDRESVLARTMRDTYDL